MPVPGSSLARRLTRRARWRAVAAGKRALRAALVRAARARPTAAAQRGSDRRVVILLASAWGMGGTIRAALNLAGHLAATHDVEVLSAHRRRPVPFMGEFPEGVTVTALDDQRLGVQTGLEGWLAARLRRLGSVLVHPAEVGYQGFSLWSDIQLVRHLRRGAGVAIGTRPGLNLALAELALPGFRAVGQEQMNLGSHSARLRRAMAAGYGRLDALAVLTDRDRADYRALLGEDAPPIACIPNTVRAVRGRRADLDRKTVLAAGRLTTQKGFDLLIRAWVPVAAAHPDWTLRIHGRGRLRAQLRALIDELGLAETVRLRRGARDLGGRMRRASIYALSSRFEGFPLVLLEAMGHGMAVAAFDCPTGPGEAIDHRGNGLLVPARDVAALSGALLELIEDRDLRHRCGAAALETARGYTMAAIGPRWETLLDEARTGRTGRELSPRGVLAAGELDAPPPGTGTRRFAPGRDRERTGTRRFAPGRDRERV